MLPEDHYIFRLRVVSNVFNDDFLVNIFAYVPLPPKHFYRMEFAWEGNSTGIVKMPDSSRNSRRFTEFFI